VEHAKTPAFQPVFVDCIYGRKKLNFNQNKGGNLYAFLVVLEIVIAILLIAVVLMQSSKGGGLAGSFGGTSASFGNVFGVRKTADILSRMTTILGTVFIVLAFLINLFFLPNKVTTEQKSFLQTQGQQQLPAQQVPQVPLQTPASTPQK
jgi:preprotein translocase subunit SecG